MSNRDEYGADTNPTNAFSSFRILTATSSPNVAISFQSSASRVHTLYLRTNLAIGAWAVVSNQAAIPGVNGVMVLTNPLPATPESYFRIGVQCP